MYAVLNNRLTEGLTQKNGSAVVRRISGRNRSPSTVQSLHSPDEGARARADSLCALICDRITPRHDDTKSDVVVTATIIVTITDARAPITVQETLHSPLRSAADPTHERQS